MGNPFITAIQILPIFRLETRSATLDGSIPVRAAQGCKPFLDGNDSGLHLTFQHPAMVAFDGAKAVLRLAPKGMDDATRDYSARLESTVTGGYLARDSYWHRYLASGFAHQEGDILRIWTGYLVKPAVDSWILVGAAFNRKCVARVREFVISDPSEYVPLILDLELSSLRHRETWLDTELATLNLLRPGTRLDMKPLREVPDLGQAFFDFYSPTYLKDRGDVKYTGRYRQQTTQLPSATASDEFRIQVAYCAERADLVSRGMFDLFLTAEGLATQDPLGKSLEFGITHAL